MENDYRMKHSNLLYDYIKFHLGLYIVTPPLMVIVATVFSVKEKPIFQYFMAGMVVIYFITGACASFLIASYVNVKWSDDSRWLSFGEQHAHKLARRFVHHHLY